MSRLPRPSLHLVTSRTRLAPDAPTVAKELASLERQIDEAVEAGVDVVQIRERDLPAGVLLALVARLARRVASTNTVLLVNERADVAVVAGAGGVHLPAFGLPATRVRSLAPRWTVGRSIHAEDVPDDRGDCDYLLFGTVFVSESKGVESPAAGVDALAAAVKRVERPVIAIGGIVPERASACLAAGAAGVAAIGAFLPSGLGRDARGVRAATSAFRAAMAEFEPRGRGADPIGGEWSAVR